MFKLILRALFCASVLIYIAFELLELPTDLAHANVSLAQGIPSVSGNSIRASLHIPIPDEPQAFSTNCYIARTACEWVRSNPGIPIEAQVIRGEWPTRQWLVSFKATNDFVLQSSVQERELSSYKGRTAFGLFGFLVVSIYLLYIGRKSGS